MVVEEDGRWNRKGIESIFKTLECFAQYITNCSRLKVVEEAWLRRHVEMTGVGINDTGIYRCPAALLREKFKQFGVSNI